MRAKRELKPREESNVVTRFHSYVIDDGWHLPYEIIEEIECSIAKARDDAQRKVNYENQCHKGLWINEDVVRQYVAKSWIYRELEDHQYCGKVREIGTELQILYGVTELEARNILFERNVEDYLNKYYRMEHRIPNFIDEQRICDRVIAKYSVAM